MKQMIFVFGAGLVLCISSTPAAAQNTSPFWSLAGNSNAGAASKLGTTNAVPLRLVTNNAERIRIEPSNGNVGINNTAPIGRFTVQNNGTLPSADWVTAGQPLFAGFGEDGAGSADYILSMASNSDVRSVLIGRRARGTLATPAAVQNNDFLFSFLASGYDGSAFQNPAAIDVFVDGAPSNGNVPARISFVTGSNIGNRAERLVVKANGDVGIGTTAPERTLHVFDGSAGLVTSNAQAPLVVENNTNTYANLLAPNTGEAGVLFGNPGSAQDGGLIYSNVSDRMFFRTNGNVTRMTLEANGDVGIGTTLPANRLHIRQNVANRAIEWQHETQADFWTVGIGTNTLNCRFEFNGSAKGQISSIDGAYTQFSDKRLKQDIALIADVSEKVMQLKPSTYYYTDTRSVAKRKSIGFIAQDVETLFPELVYEDDNSFKSLNYAAFSVIAIKVVQEQQARIEKLEAELSNLKALVTKLANGQTVNVVTSAALGQSTPNPSTNTTRISYSIPSQSHAQLLLTDASGKTIKTIILTSAGYVNINTSNLSSGVYNYALVVNGVAVHTKKLTIAR